MNTSLISIQQQRLTTNLLKNSDEESENCEDVEVWSESVGHAHDNHRPLTDQKDRFTSELVW